MVVDWVDDLNEGSRTESITAVTYMVKRGRQSADKGIPSPRYVACLLAGALECGLPSAYIRSLRAMGTASD